MTTLAPTHEDRITVLDLLGAQGRAHLTADEIADALIEADRDGARSGGVDNMSTAARRAVYGQVAVAAHRLLDVDLTDAIVGGWLKYKALVDAGRRTLGSAAREIVELVSHRITSTYKPVIQVYVDGLPVGSVEFRLELVFEIIGCSAVVAAGDLVAVEGGDVKVTGTLAVKGKAIATKSKQFDSHLVVNLRRPVHLTQRAS
ncbi:hypothetical protein ACFQ58_14340 [Agromyces sp. NPDC056523]|uniref:hypothetical protein n=1 Tax=Agromyces sp. NPDC056523 TaxID=3345850 RepID=UPI003671E684